jgi:RimJ/RimL family protein N-acetyltransferase
MGHRSQHTLEDGRTLQIREATGTDAAALLEYIESIAGETEFLTFGPGELGMTVEQERDFVEGCRASAHQAYLLGIVEGEIVGTIHFASRDRARLRHVGEFGMSVRRSDWGRGIGRLLLVDLIEWARGTGIVTKINLRVRGDNERAIALYARHGFVHEGTLSRDIRLGDTYFATRCMGLEL